MSKAASGASAEKRSPPKLSKPWQQVSKAPPKSRTADFISAVRDGFRGLGLLRIPLIPGDPEREAEVIRSKEGIPLIKPVVDDLLDISAKTGIPFELK